MQLEYLPKSTQYRNPLHAYARARKLANTYWRPFIVTATANGRYCIKVFVPPPGHDDRTQCYITRSGRNREIFYPPIEPTGVWRAQLMANETFEIEVTVNRITEKAYLVTLENPNNNQKTEEMWIPKSQVKDTDCLASGDEGTMEITAWIAKQKGLLEEEDE